MCEDEGSVISCKPNFLAYCSVKGGGCIVSKTGGLIVNKSIVKKVKYAVHVVSNVLLFCSKHQSGC